MAHPLFIRLNIDWNAEPNVPLPEVSAAGAALELRILVTAPREPGQESEAMKLTFGGCRVWRLSDINDEGWYRGQCRYRRLAPQWGQFYEISGDDALRDQPDDWQTMPQPGKAERHFLFYLRDETFECIADSWLATPIRARAQVSNTISGLVGISGVEYLG